MTRRRREILRCAAASLAAACWQATAETANAVSPAARAVGANRGIAVTVSKFAFNPTTIRARVGETITLVLTSIDFVHGFAIPELNVRVDVPPGRPIELTLPSLREGRFIYLCDNFCGEGHDKMSGVLVATTEYGLPAAPPEPNHCAVT
jgi:cytochrome c oxidase subunit II